MLEVYDLSKSYSGQQVLKGIEFKVSDGETLAIMGPSGSGKSTAIRCINRLVEADKGQIIFAGEDIMKLSYQQLLKLRKKIGFVFQSYNLLAHLNVVYNVMLPLLNQDITYQAAEKKAVKMLKEVRLADKTQEEIANLSGGEKQRVAIARALVTDPKLLLFDEPTAALDPILVQEVLEIIEKLAAKRNKTIIIVTHEISFALKVADRIILLDNGQIAEEESAELIFDSPTSNIGKKYKKLFEYYK